MMLVEVKIEYVTEHSGNWEENMMHHKVQKVSRSHTPEGKRTRYCADEFVKHSMTHGNNTATANMFNCPFDCDFFNEKEDIYLLHLKQAHGFAKNNHVKQKESCNQCEFTCETKTELAKHTSEVHKNCVQSRQADGTAENNTPMEALQKMFLCPFNCDFSNEGLSLLCSISVHLELVKIMLVVIGHSLFGFYLQDIFVIS